MSNNMTPEQIDNVRRVMSYMCLLPPRFISDEMVINFRNNLQAKINALSLREPGVVEEKPKPTEKKPEPKFEPKNDAELSAYRAGRDCAVNGPNFTNYHYSISTAPELKAAWEAGKREALSK